MGEKDLVQGSFVANTTGGRGAGGREGGGGKDCHDLQEDGEPVTPLDDFL